MSTDPREDRVLTLEEVIPEGFDLLPPDAPLVAVVVSLTFPGMVGESHRIMRDFTRSAFDQLLESGARAILIDSSAADPRAALAAEEADAVLFLGGGDVDGSLYELQGPIPKAYGVDRTADEFCIALIHRTLEKDQPLLAICRGSQLLNVALGGTLVPDIVPSTLHQGQSGQPMFLDEGVTLAEGSKIRGILGRGRVTVRSGHHQAVDRVAADLIVSAVADDGIVEGTEHPGKTWAVAVQWHPEDRDGSAEDRRAIFGALVDQGILRRRQVAQLAQWA
ncbi:gamma-glutamyl-gamma-aminobutyrate hydrolase family protein [Paeniglutamicibacter sp. ABSL32-1]|uniref:gamma-glutamyl-gamma-aminobutyrate hydrolase family protein n=1 Tax=Paeniglutamicibacter quisquiliarum TaxID=2849498 RepID=UPI001C2D7385|nr:gamma-glutamyl-gamma-aminobutyrate hydrolase family protein [Paeniglutamicibacter quisquiliarum]MBV1778957.1 gamma-glutamyl-gamma-aminobutyrate hydrolase family protein [Paeniglutamicibacter quisquiliarum]